MKESGTAHWESPNAGATNESGFTALPGGQRQVGTLGDIHLGEEAWIWPAIEGSSPSTLITSYGLTHTSAALSTAQHSKNRGHAVRCKLDPQILGCTSTSYMEYSAAANLDDGSCQTPAIPGCTDSRYVNFNPSANLDDGSCSHLIGCTPSDSLSLDGYTYELVTIGEQCWFAENLRTTVYADGSSVPEVQNNAEWGALSTGAQCSYGNSSSNLEAYGRLYNWYAVDDSRGLCPSGWHVPSDTDWTVLTDYLGGTSVAGLALKANASNNPMWDGTNSSGFSATPGGFRKLDGGYYAQSAGVQGFFWSASLSTPSKAWNRKLNSGSGSVIRAGSSLESYVRCGLSVRCLRDE